MKKNAFTMLELVLVIVVLGILAAITIPRLDRDLKQEAADNVLSAIRYTQHLALNDNKQKFDNKKWQQRFWKIMFAQCSDGKDFYKIGSDDNMDSDGSFSKDEAALDPSNSKPMYMINSGNCKDSTVSPNIFIGKKYGITNVSGTGGCSSTTASKHIGFDYLGRPHVSFGGSSKPDSSSYMQTECIFTFNLSNGDSFQIRIQPETGYAYIDGQPNS